MTRRRGKKRWNVGAIHKCYTRPPFAKGGAEPFARVRIVSVTLEQPMMGGMTVAKQEAEARLEGFPARLELYDTYQDINGEGSQHKYAWRVEFELLKEAAS